MVLCYGAVFFLVVRFVAFILLPKTVYLKSFWGPLGVILGSSGGHFGTLWLHFGGLGLPRGPHWEPLQAKADFQQIWGGFAPPFGVPILVHFRQKSRKIELQKRNFVRLVVDSPFFYKMVEK